MIGLLDYGAGNLFSVQNSLREIGVEFRLVRSAEEVESCRALLLPGVGHFSMMMSALDLGGLRQPIVKFGRSGRPLLGICLGMQALFDSSEEAPGVEGLGLLSGQVRRFPDSVRVPQIGWSKVEFCDGRADWFTFANSFAVLDSPDGWGSADHGGSYWAAVRRETIWGLQFHPEKSSLAGLEILKEWCDLAG